MAQEEILGVDRHVGLELALPPAVAGAAARAGARRARSSVAWRGVDRAVGGDRHAGRLLDARGAVGASSASAAAAAARPLRTALSIVAGQPVSVHAPAR